MPTAYDSLREGPVWPLRGCFSTGRGPLSTADPWSDRGSGGRSHGAPSSRHVYGPPKAPRGAWRNRTQSSSSGTSNEILGGENLSTFRLRECHSRAIEEPLSRRIRRRYDARWCSRQAASSASRFLGPDPTFAPPAGRVGQAAIHSVNRISSLRGRS